MLTAHGMLGCRSFHMHVLCCMPVVWHIVYQPFAAADHSVWHKLRSHSAAGSSHAAHRSSTIRSTAASPKLLVNDSIFAPCARQLPQLTHARLCQYMSQAAWAMQPRCPSLLPQPTQHVFLLRSQLLQCQCWEYSSDQAGAMARPFALRCRARTQASQAGRGQRGSRMQRSSQSSHPPRDLPPG